MNTFAGEIITLLLMAFALGMDAFSVRLGMGMFKLRLRQILFIGLTVGFFHIWMPLLGMGAARFISDKFGTFATYAGGLLLLILGIQMFIPGKRGEAGIRDNKMLAPIGKGLFIFALGVSLDSFSVGLTLGIYGAKTILTILLFWNGCHYFNVGRTFTGEKHAGVTGSLQ